MLSSACMPCDSWNCGICKIALYTVAGLQQIMPLYSSCFLFSTHDGWKHECIIITMAVTHVQHVLRSKRLVVSREVCLCWLISPDLLGLLAEPGCLCKLKPMVALVLQSQKHVGTSRRMKNPEKIAASKKKPLVARYILGNRVILTRDPAYVPEYAN